MFPLEKYVYFVDKNIIKAVQTYAGRCYIGTAKCAPEDKFDFEIGKQLAAARCNLKIAAARLKATNKKLQKLYKDWSYINAELNKLDKVKDEAYNSYEEAHNEVVKLESTL